MWVFPSGCACVDVDEEHAHDRYAWLHYNALRTGRSCGLLGAAAVCCKLPTVAVGFIGGAGRDKEAGACCGLMSNWSALCGIRPANGSSAWPAACSWSKRACSSTCDRCWSWPEGLPGGDCVLWKACQLLAKLAVLGRDCAGSGFGPEAASCWEQREPFVVGVARALPPEFCPAVCLSFAGCRLVADAAPVACSGLVCVMCAPMATVHPACLSPPPVISCCLPVPEISME